MSPTQMNPRVAASLLNVEDAAEFLACTSDRIYELVDNDRLRHHRLGERILFDRDDLQSFADSSSARRA